MHFKFKESFSKTKHGLYHEYLSLDGWFEKKFSIGYDYTLYDGLKLRSLRLGWIWFSLCECVDKVEDKTNV